MTAITPNHFVWQETRPGRYERDLDEPELFYTTLEKLYQGTGKHFFAITGYIEVSVKFAPQASAIQTGTLVEDALRKAWRRLRYEHPTLASFVEYDTTKQKCRKVYETLTSEEEAAWLDASFKIVENRQSGLEFYNSDPPVNKQATLYLITPPTTSSSSSNSNSDSVNDNDLLRREIVLRSHHDVIDGVVTLILLDNLSAHAAEAYALPNEYSEVEFGDEAKNLSPCFRIAASIAASPTVAQQERAREIMAANAAAAEGIEVLGIPFEAKTALPGRHQRVASRLTIVETEEMLRACRENGVSVTQAFHAGIIIALRDLQEKAEHEKDARYVGYCLLNLRARCTHPYSSAQHPASVYHSASGNNLGVDITVPAGSSAPPSAEKLTVEYLSILNKVKEFYLGVQADPEHVAMVPLYFDAITPAYPTEETEVPPPNKCPSISISSLGVLDKIIQPQHGAFTLSDPWVTGEELSPGVGVFLGAWRGRLEISAAYNDAYHDEKRASELLERIKAIVFQTLVGKD